MKLGLSHDQCLLNLAGKAESPTDGALLMKHFLPLFPRKWRCVAAFVSAKVGSIGDDVLGGYRQLQGLPRQLPAVVVR